MRSIWKGALSFGLVTIPVKVYSATQQNDISFHQVHVTDGGRIRYKRVCEVDGDEVAYQDIAKGYELPTGEVVVLTDDDLEGLPLSSSKVIDVLEFVPAEQVDPIYFAKSYYLEPEAIGVKPYVLLRDALGDSNRVAVVKVALRQRESLATVRVRDGVLVLETMLWPDEIREPDFGFLTEDVAIRKQELTMAESLIESMTADFDPTQFSDAYREALEAVVQAKIEGREVVAPAVPERTGEVVDLMAALTASVKNARKSRGDDDSAGEAKRDSGPRAVPKATTSTKSAKPAGKSAKRSAKAAGAGKATKAAKPAKAAKRAKKSA
jgi:DNA end-binding protein Ku